METQSGTRRSWSAWLAQGISDAPETGGGLIVAAIQLAIMLGGAFGGALLDHFSIAGTFCRRHGASHFRITRRSQWRALEDSS